MSIHLDTGQTSGCVLAITGDADLYAAAGVELDLVRLINEGQRRIVVDLTDTTLVDSTMLRVLLNASRRLRAVHGELLIVCSGPNIPMIFEITLLDGVFKIFETREQALAHLGRMP